MPVHANILDSILNTPTQATKTASANVGDLFMDADTRSAARPKDNRTAAALEGGELLDGFNIVAKKQAAANQAKKAVRFRTIQEAVKFAQQITAHPAGMKLASVTAAKHAGERLARLLRKTPEQMQADGASKLADYLNPQIVPAWAKQIRADLKALQSIRDGLTLAKQPKQAAGEVEHRDLSDAEVKAHIKSLLNSGVAPKDVAANLEKLADLQMFNKSMAQEYLNDHAGVLGLAYLEPNHYMNDCPSTYERMKGKVAAKSVKQIEACAGCQNFKKSAAGKNCSLYKLPVVASQSELFPIINNLVGGANNKKAALVAIANNETAQAATKTAYGSSKAKGKMLSRTARYKKAEPEFTKEAVGEMHAQGTDLKSIYAHGVKTAGARQAQEAVKGFVAGLKTAKTKIALTQIDCSILGGKLASNNAIHGAAKCGSCTYRNGMHCGFTGGTLLTFPGMDKVKSNHRVASGAPKDGTKIVEEFDLLDRQPVGDIELLEDVAGGCDLNQFSEINL